MLLIELNLQFCNQLCLLVRLMNLRINNIWNLYSMTCRRKLRFDSKQNVSF